MDITFDPAKHEKTLNERQIDFRDAREVFEGITYTFEDVRFAYPERRFVSLGMLRARMVVVVWTPNAEPLSRHIISMRKANA